MESVQPATPPRLSAGRNFLGLLFWLLLCFSAASLGALFLPGEWYAQLKKPSWNPPNWLFGPVWTTLYVLMAVAAWRVWQLGGFRAQKRPLLLFLTQLCFNAIWSFIFFGKHQMLLGFIDICALWCFLLLTFIAFWRVRPLAAWLLIPYLAWISFAAFLNFTIWRLNS